VVERPLLNLMLTRFGLDSGKNPYTKVVDNVNTFLASINISSSEKRSRSNDLWKVGVLLEYLDRSSYLDKHRPSSLFQ
jgi:hypothetical protein